MAKIQVTYRVADKEDRTVSGGLLHPNGHHHDFKCASIFDPQFLLDTDKLDLGYVCRRALGLQLKPGPIFPCSFKFESVPCKWELSNYTVVYTMEIMKDDLIDARRAYTQINQALKSPARVLGHS